MYEVIGIQDNATQAVKLTNEDVKLTGVVNIGQDVNEA